MKAFSIPNLCVLFARNPTRLSQAMHNAAFTHFGLEFCYVAFHVEDTITAINAMRDLGIRGCSLTIPHKERAVPLVDSCEQSISEIGAINTVINQGDTLRGYNTDVYGIQQAFNELGYSLKGKAVLILGAGGAARAAVYAMKQASAARICILNRTMKSAELMAEQMSVETVAAPDVSTNFAAQFDVIINATPLGSCSLTGPSKDLHLISFSALHSMHCVFDMVTNKTPLLQMAGNAGAKTIAGSRMLLHQACLQFKYFTEQQAPIDCMERALEQAIIQSEK